MFILGQRKWFHILKKATKRQYLSEIITEADYADDLVLLTNTPAQAKSLLQSLEQVAGSIGIYVDVNKTEFMCLIREKLSHL